MTGLSTKERAPSSGVGIKMMLLVGLISGVVAALSTLLVQSLLTPAPLKVATVDVTGLVTSEISRLQETGMDSATHTCGDHCSIGPCRTSPMNTVLCCWSVPRWLPVRRI